MNDGFLLNIVKILILYLNEKKIMMENYRINVYEINNMIDKNIIKSDFSNTLLQ